MPSDEKDPAGNFTSSPAFGERAESRQMEIPGECRRGVFSLRADYGMKGTMWCYPPTIEEHACRFTTYHRQVSEFQLFTVKASKRTAAIKPDHAHKAGHSKFLHQQASPPI